jgi:hypothetical protein
LLAVVLAKSLALALLNDINAITKIALLEDDIAGLEMFLMPDSNATLVCASSGGNNA